MSLLLLVLGGATLGWPGAVAGTAADSVTLRDGKVILGEVVEPAPRGAFVVTIRRSWAHDHLPEMLAKWEVAEAPAARRATAQRRERLVAWRRERPKSAGGNDRITPWLDRELARPDTPAATPLMSVRLNRGEVKSVAKAAAGSARLLRLAWVSELKGPEGLPPESLADALEGRGFDPKGTAPVGIDNLLPPQAETDAAWLVRRGATEVLNDPGLKFLRFQGAVLPEPAPGEGVNLANPAMALEGLKDLLGGGLGGGGNAEDPLAARLRGVAARGAVGAVVTALDLGGDGAEVRAEMTMWVRHPGDRWTIAGTRSTRVRTDDLGADAGKDLASDPQIDAAFKMIESIGLGGVDPAIKRRALNSGAAVQRALAQTRTLANADLQALALPVLETPRDAPRP